MTFSVGAYIPAMTVRTALTLALAVVSIACETSAEPSDSSLPPPDDGGGGALACPELLACFAACSDGDEPCMDDCLGRAASTGLADALATCADGEGCTDAACITANCEMQRLACEGVVGPPETAPVQIEGTVRDTIALVGLDSNGTVLFVRDDAAGAAVGLGGPDTAFYRLEQVDYTATQMMDMGCAYSASETVSFTNPPALGNNITFNTINGEYSITTTLTEARPDALTITCPPPAGAMVQEFGAALNVSNGTPLPTSDGHTFRGTAMAPGGVDRTWTWDLTGTP